jgi:hypothetical protein
VAQKTFVQKAAHKILVKLTPGVNFINIFGKKRMLKSAKLPANCRKNRTLCAENLQSFFWHMSTSEKQLFVIRAKKPRINMLVKLTPVLPAQAA